MIESRWRSGAKSDCFKTIEPAEQVEKVEPSEPVERPENRPRLVMDLDNEEVVLDGHHYQFDRKTLLVLHVLWQAKGQPLDRPQIRAAHPELELEVHPERPIKRLWQGRRALGKVIEKNKHGYRIRPEFLE